MFASLNSLLTGNASGNRARGNTGKKGRDKTLFLADYLTAFCDAGATSFLLTSTQVRRLQKNVGTNVYKLTGPHRLWFTVSVDEGLLRWSSQAYSEREESFVPSAGSLVVEQPSSMCIRLEDIVEIKKGSPKISQATPESKGENFPPVTVGTNHGVVVAPLGQIEQA